MERVAIHGEQQGRLSALEALFRGQNGPVISQPIQRALGSCHI